MAIMGPYERRKRDQQRAREREARRSELVGLGTPVSQTRVAPAINRSPYEGVQIGTPVSQTRVAPVINRSPYEGVRIGNSQQGSYEYGKDMRENGFVERMDINGNYRWVDPKTGMQPDGSPLNPARTQPGTRTVTEPTSAQQAQTEPQEPVTSLPEPFTTGTQPNQEPTPVVAAMPTEESAAQNQQPPNNQQGLTEDEKEDRAAAKGGEEDRFAMSRNFLATDKVPDSIFGYPIASRKEDYTPEDIEFFRRHPEAGGYYDLGEGSPEDEPVQAAGAGNTRGRYPGSLNNPGNTGKHARKDRKDWTGEVDSPHDRWAKFDTPQNGLLAAAVAMRKIADGKLKPAGQPFTIRNYAYKYAPPEENDTEAYIRNISRYSGLDPDTELDRYDVDAMAKLLRAKVRFESGVPHSEWFTDGEYREAAEALQEGAYE